MCVCVRGTFRLSSRLMAKASCNCNSSSPLVAGRACSKSGSKRGEEDGATWAEEERERRRDEAVSTETVGEEININRL